MQADETLGDFVQADELIGEFKDVFDTVKADTKCLNNPRFSCHEKLVTLSAEDLENDVVSLADLEERFATFRSRKEEAIQGALYDSINVVFTGLAVLDLRREYHLRKATIPASSLDSVFSAVGMFTNAAHAFLNRDVAPRLSATDRFSLQNSFGEVARAFVDAQHGNPSPEVMDASDQDVLSGLLDSGGKLSVHTMNLLTEQLDIVNSNNQMLWSWERALVKGLIAEDKKPEMRDYLQNLRLSSEASLAVIGVAYPALKDFHQAHWAMFENPRGRLGEPTRYVEPPMDKIFTIPFLFR